MHYARLIIAFVAAAVLGAFAACGTAPPKCSPASCGGCCDASDTCQTANTQTACGSAGNTCLVCGAGTSCASGVCRSTATGGGTGGGSTGGGTGGGATGGGTGGGATGGGTGGGATGGGTGGGGTGGGSTGGGTGGGATGGGTGGATGGGTGGGSAIFDAGVILPDGGALNPPTIPLTFMTTCGSVVSCPGNEVAAWVYSAGCIDDSAFSRVTAAAMQAQCTSSISNKNGSVAGSVIFNGTTVSRTVVGAVNFTLTATGPICLQACSFIPGNLPPGIRGTCAVVGAACECTLSFDIGESGAQTYSYAAGQLALASGDTYNTCITGSSLRYRETTDGGIPGVFTLTK